MKGTKAMMIREQIAWRSEGRRHDQSLCLALVMVS